MEAGHDGDLEERILDMEISLTGREYQIEDDDECKLVCKFATHQVMWKKRLYFRSKTGLRKVLE